MTNASGNTTDVSPWPDGHFEAVPHCPVCQVDAGRDLWHGGITDRVFGIAPGAWSLYRCRNCASGWLDPRPDANSLPRAYTNYFTHAETYESVAVKPRGWVRRSMRHALNDYMNHRYGTDRAPAIALGRFLTWPLRPLRATVDVACRHLPRVPDEGGFLLDVGCGNGDFLKRAREMGWSASGLDFDPQAVKQATRAGLDVDVGGVEILDSIADRYDVITLAHVIEHVPDPNLTLSKLWRLLKPGGMLWLETPNLESLGHRIYGKHWRGLEAPRHLVLFNPTSMSAALTRAGFENLEQQWHALSSIEMLRASDTIRRGRNSKLTSGISRYKLFEMTIETLEALLPNRREFITMTAQKPAPV